MRHLLAALFALIAFTQTAAAATETYVLDKPHTQIIFFVDHMGFTKSSGKFLDYTGRILWDKEAPEKSSVEVTIKTASLEMGDATWNEHLTSPRFFDAAKYPEMTFKSTGIKVTGEKTADITGDLTLHGATRPVTLAVTFNKAERVEMMNRNEAGFSATASLKRTDFGMSEGVPFVGDDVRIQLEV